MLLLVQVEVGGPSTPREDGVAPPHEGVVLAAGAGMRLRPITETCPKPLLPLSRGDVILDSIAANAKGMGLDSLKVIAREHESQFRLACARVAEQNGFDVTLEMLPAPTASSLETLRLGLRRVTEPVAVFLGDDVTITNSMLNLVEAYIRTRPAILEAVTREEDKRVLQHSCAVAIDGAGRIKHIQEKPTEPISNIRGCGIYILSDPACEVVRDPAQSRIHEITELVDYFARRELAAYEFVAGLNINVNTPEDLTRAQQVYRLAHDRPRASS